MIISHEFVAHASMEAVFDALTTEQVLTGLRGVQVGGRDSQGNIEGALELDVEGAPLRFSGQLTALEADREAGALTMTLTGNQGRSRQQSRCLVAVRLRSSNGSTTVSMQLDVDIAGRGNRADTYPLREAVLEVVDNLALAVREHLVVAAGVGGPRATGTAAPIETAPIGEAAVEPAAAPGATSPLAESRAEPAAPPARPRYADPGSPVPGRVVVVTSTPLDGSTLPVGDSATDRVRTAAGERPWLAPLVLLGILALLLVLRRRRSRSQP